MGLVLGKQMFSAIECLRHGFNRFRCGANLHATSLLSAFENMPALSNTAVGGGEGGGSAGAGAGRRTVVPAQDTNNSSGMLCIEVRIRLYHDGAMSKLLESLAKVRIYRRQGRSATQSLFPSCSAL